MSQDGIQPSFLLAFAKSMEYAKIRVMVETWVYTDAASRIDLEEEDEDSSGAMIPNSKVKTQHEMNSTFCNRLR